MWKSGMIDGYYYEVKVYAEGSVFGIDEGKISKLYLKKGDLVIANFDRGWDIEPTAAADLAIMNKLIALFN